MTEHLDTSIRNPIAVRDALRVLCDKNQLLLLVTPYMKFESNFLRLDAEAVQVAALMSREDALFGLRSPDLRIRFPHGHQFYEASTRLLGLGQARGRQALSLEIPLVMQVDDYRSSYRVERVGRLVATFSSRRYDLLMANVMNLSTSGVRIFAQRDFEDGEVLVDDVVHVSLTVTPEISINTKAKVRYVKDRMLGLEFRPRPEGKLLDALSAWVFQKKEEEQALGAGLLQVQAPTASAAGPVPAPALVLVGGDAELEGRLKELLKDLPPLGRVAPAIQTMRELAGAGRSLILFHVGSLAHEDRKRARILLEAASGRVPVVLLGTDVEPSALFELAAEVKAVSAYTLGSTSSGFFPRLLQGILRKHFTAPADAP